MKIELSHDLLAKKIHEKASAEDKMLLRIRNFIQDRFSYFSDNKALLSLKDIHYITPYLDKLNLEPHEKRFIRRSKDRIWIFGIAIGIIVLGVVGTIFYFINKTDRMELKNRELLAAQLARYEKINQHAQELSNALTASREGLHATEEELYFALLALQERNDTLVNSYATYKVKQDYSIEQLKQELKVAQSSKLSELATSLVNSDKAYSFRLASKSWRLNPDNQQAMKVLYSLASIPVNEKYSKQKIYTIIKEYKQTWGNLSKKDFTAIFHPENKVTTQKNITAQVQKTITAPLPPPTSSPIKQKDNEVSQKIKQEREQIKQQVEKIDMQLQKVRAKENQSSK